MNAPGFSQFGHHHLIAASGNFFALRTVIEIPLIKQIFSPWNIVLSYHQKSVYHFDLCLRIV